MNISQSFLKDYKAYRDKKLCGLQLKAKYYDGVDFPPTEPMLIGVWFEYLCTGGMPRSGIIPEPETLSTGKNKGEYKDKWKKAAEQANRFKKAMLHYGFMIKHVGIKLVTGEEGQGEEGTIDVIATDTRQQIEASTGLMVDNPDFGQEIIIDIKSTGLLDDKWNEMGWELASLNEKPRIMVQAVHYTWLYNKKFGRYPSFYFFVHSNTNGVDSRIIRIRIDPDKYRVHETQIELSREAAEQEAVIGFKPYPTVGECFNCPVKANCSSYIDVPKIDVVYHGGA